MYKEASVEEEYKKDPNLKKEDVVQFREWVEHQKHLPKVSELQLILFLQSCYYSNEAAKRALDTYFTIRNLTPDVFSNRIPEKVMHVLDVNIMTFLPDKTPEGYAVMVHHFLDCDPVKYNFTDSVKLMDMLTVLNLHVHGTSEGGVVIFDMEGEQFGHFMKNNPMLIKKYLYYLQEALPVRLKQIHVVNTIPLLDKFLTLVKPFMKKEMFDMLHIHSKSMDSLYEFVPKKILPKDYGGEADSFLTLKANTKKYLLDNKEFFEWEKTQKVDESQRSEKAQKDAIDKVFGMEGTFKKLSID